MAIFDYYTHVETAHTLLQATYSSVAIENPSDDVFLWSVINPGHTGTTVVIEYDFYVYWIRNAGSAGTLAYKIQIKASGGSWADLYSGAVADPGTGAYGLEKSTGIYTTAVLCPFELQIIGTDADATWQIESSAAGGIGGAYLNGSRVYPAYYGAIRAFGTVT